MSLGQVLDYSAGFPGAAAIKAAGYLGAVRYIGLPGNRKNTTEQELEDFRLHELGMALVFERLATDWAMGYAGGQMFGRQARDHANAIGFPADRPIYMAVDQQVNGAAAHDTAMAYLFGAASVLGGKAMTGVYGQASVVARARNEGFGYRWQTKAWSGGQVAAGIHLLQNIGTAYVGGIACDTNEVLADDWGQDGGDMALTDDDVARIGNHIKDKVLNGTDDARVLVFGPDRDANGNLVRRTIMQTLAQHGAWQGEHMEITRDAREEVLAAVEGIHITLTPEQLAELAAGITVDVSLDGGYTVQLQKTS